MGFQRRPAAGRGTGMAGDAPAAQEDADQGGGRVDIDRLADRGIGHRVGGAVDHDMVVGRQLVTAPGARDEAVRRQRPQMGTLLFGQDRVRQVVLSPLSGAAFSVARRSRIAALAASRLTKTVSRTGASTRRSTCKTAFSTAALSSADAPASERRRPGSAGRDRGSRIDGGIVEEALTPTQGIGHQAGWNAANMLQQMVMGGQPILRPLGPGRFGRCSRNGEQAAKICAGRASACSSSGHAGVIDLQGVARQMVAPQPGNRPGGLPVRNRWTNWV